MTSHSDRVRAFDFAPAALKFYGSVDNQLPNPSAISRSRKLDALKLRVGEEEVMESIRQSQDRDRERDIAPSPGKHGGGGDDSVRTDRGVLMETNGRHSPETITRPPVVTVKTETQLSPMGIQRKYHQRYTTDHQADDEGDVDDEACSPDSRPPVFHHQHPHTAHTPSSEKATTSPGSQEWTFEEQFKQLYELTEDPKRKEFLDDLFSYMQKRGTPVNRIPIMAKQTLDLYELFKLVVAKGGLVEVINKKLWREITKGLNLPSSITSAAFTLRTQYMKYLYPYECEKLKMSSPIELQAAIDGNRREGRRSSYSSSSFLQSPGSPPPSMVPQPLRMHNSTGNNGSASLSSGDDDSLPSTPTHHSHPGNPILLPEVDGPLPPKRLMYSEEQVRQIQQQMQPRELPQSTHIKITSARDSGMPLLELRGDNSLIVSIELNGVLYQGILYARGTPGHPLHPSPTVIGRPPTLRD